VASARGAAPPTSVGGDLLASGDQIAGEAAAAGVQLEHALARRDRRRRHDRGPQRQVAGRASLREAVGARPQPAVDRHRVDAGRAVGPGHTDDAALPDQPPRAVGVGGRGDHRVDARGAGP
jgi:hypothetical protein